jgi:triosephosphate isomerase
MKKKLIAGNWKMNNTPDASIKLIEAIKSGINSDISNNVNIVFFPPYTSLEMVSKLLLNSGMFFGAQNVYFKNEGAYTGEISAPMLNELGCKYVIIGHSERRSIFKETDEEINLKIENSINSNIIPVFCIGETLSERNEEIHYQVIEKQLNNGLKNINFTNPESIVIAYEPVWAIGTGLTSTPEQANEMHKYIRIVLEKMYNNDKFTKQIRILYGGSMNEGNSKSLLEMSDIDGGLIGGASLKSESFIKIIKSAIL